MALRTARQGPLRPEETLLKEKTNLKMPGGAGFEPHRDQQAGWSGYAPLFITALVWIDRATERNGCLKMADAPPPRRPHR